MSGLIPQNVLLVSETKIKNFTDIDQNVTSAVILPFLSYVQQAKLEYIIGGKYYKQLLEGVINSNLSQTDTEFIEYFAAPLVLWAGYSECLSISSDFPELHSNIAVRASSARLCGCLI